MSEVRDLGVFREPVLICGGAYGNLEALEALLAMAGQKGIPEQQIIHTGDAAAYCADGADVAGKLRISGIHCLKGNVEEQLAEGAENCGCGFDEGSACDVLSASWFLHARRSICGVLKAWMRHLPGLMRFQMGGRRFLVVHGAASSINRFLFASHSDDMFRQELVMTDCDGIIGGHCGLPFTRCIDGRIWHNSGALGMPANDGTARVWYSLLVPVQSGIRISHHPLDYPHEAAADKIRQRGLAAPYADALESGLWPGVAILPPAERDAAGRALAPRSRLWRNDGTVEEQ